MKREGRHTFTYVFCVKSLVLLVFGASMSTPLAREASREEDLSSVTRV